MTQTPVNWNEQLNKVHAIARKYGHEMVYHGAVIVSGKSKKRQIEGINCSDTWVCEHGECEAAIMVLSFDGTVPSLGVKGTIHSILTTPPLEYKCGVTPSPLANPANVVPGTNTIH